MKKILFNFGTALIILSFAVIPNYIFAQTSFSGCFDIGSVHMCLGTGGGGYGAGLADYSALGLPGGTITGILVNIVLWILGIFSILTIIGFIISGILYLTSAGDEDQATRAKKAMKYSIIGVIVGLSGWIIIKAIFAALSTSSVTF